MALGPVALVFRRRIRQGRSQAHRALRVATRRRLAGPLAQERGIDDAEALSCVVRSPSVLIAVSIAAPAQASGALTGATELTQILNNGELVALGGQIAEQIDNQVTQIAHQVEQIAKPDAHLRKHAAEHAAAARPRVGPG